MNFLSNTLNLEVNQSKVNAVQAGGQTFGKSTRAKLINEVQASTSTLTWLAMKSPMKILLCICFKRLPFEYGAVLANINSHREPLEIKDVQTMLLSQDTRIQQQTSDNNTSAYYCSPDVVANPE